MIYSDIFPLQTDNQLVIRQSNTTTDITVDNIESDKIYIECNNTTANIEVGNSSKVIQDISFTTNGGGYWNSRSTNYGLVVKYTNNTSTKIPLPYGYTDITIKPCVGTSPYQDYIYFERTAGLNDMCAIGYHITNYPLGLEFCYPRYKTSKDDLKYQTQEWLEDFGDEKFKNTIVITSFNGTQKSYLVNKDLNNKIKSLKLNKEETSLNEIMEYTITTSSIYKEGRLNLSHIYKNQTCFTYK